MLTIVQCVNNLDLGGLEQMVLTLAVALRERGFSSTICCVEDRGALADQAEASGIPVHALQMRCHGKLKTLRALCALCENQKPVVIHSHNFKPFYYAALATMLGATDGHVHSRHGSLLRPHPAVWRYRLLRPWVDEWVTVSADRQTELAERTGLPTGNIHVLANGIDTNRFCPAADKRTVRTALGLPLDSPIIICVARLAPEKDLGTLLRAFKILSESWIGTNRRSLQNASTGNSAFGERALPVLLFVGDGPERAKLESLTRDLGLPLGGPHSVVANPVFPADTAERIPPTGHVWFLGTRSDTHKLLQAADVFALSSLSEGLSVALIEAAACGLPIVATDVGGNPEVVNAPHGGRLVPPSNPEAMAVALREVLGNDVLRSTMSRAAREHALTRFSVKQMLNAYLALYENCVQKRGLSLTSKC